MEHCSETMLQPGDVVFIDTEKIISKPNFKDLQPAYQDFIRSATDKVFTVVKEERYAGKPIVSLLEDTSDPKWLFWEGELIRCESEGS